MANYHKGRRREWKCQQILEAAGYVTTRSSSSKGMWDVVGVKPRDVRLVSVKSGTARPSAVEREALSALALVLRGTASVEIWRFPDRARLPLIDVL